MSMKPLLLRLKAYFMHSCQLMIIEHDTHKAARNRRFYPNIFWPVITVVLLLTFVGLFLAGNYYKPFWEKYDLRPQYMQLQRLYQDLRLELNESMTNLGVRDEQINMLKQEIKQQQDKQDRLQDRLNLYDNLLAARRGDSMQLLQFTSRLMEENSFEIELALVRGGVTPRWVKGWIKVFADDGKGKKIPLLFSNSKYKLPYRIESHTFLHETVRWLQKSPPGNILYATVFDSRGKVLLRKTYSFEGE